MSKPPANTKRCGLCNCSAAGFAVYEADYDGVKAILPIGWRCQSHMSIPYHHEKWEKAREEFQKRDPGGRRPKTVIAGVSNLSEDEVTLLYQLLEGSAVSREREERPLDIPVEYVEIKP